MKPRRLIVTADDFGLSHSVNAGIVRAHREGILGFASLLANSPAFEEAVRLAVENQNLGVGVHLNVVRGTPLSDPRDISSLVGANGCFRTFRRRRQGRDFLAEAEREYRLQIEKILGSNIRPTHMDFEKHHTWQLPLYSLAARLAAEYGIPRIRNLSEPVWWALRNLGWPGWRNMAMAAALRTGFALPPLPGCVHSPDRLLGQLHIGMMDETRWLRLLDALPPGEFEVMTHPGLSGDAGAMGSSWIDSAREAEFQALLSPRVREKMRLLGIESIVAR